MLSLRGDVRHSLAVTIRSMVGPDVPAALVILRESPEASAWSEASLMESASKGAAWTAETGERIAGFLVGRIAADEFEILNLAVARAHRRCGVGTELVTAALGWSRAAGARQAFLEVRASNTGGIAFYTRLGFVICGRRLKYYQNPVEDAVRMVLNDSETIP